eukprot:COSAG06_NODE_2039_length_7765_cov_3.914427_1_plen_60_part_00
MRQNKGETHLLFLEIDVAQSREQLCEPLKGFVIAHLEEPIEVNEARSDTFLIGKKERSA